MKIKLKYLRESVKLAWRSSPSLTLANIISVFLRSFLPLLLIWLIKEVIDVITETARSSSGNIHDILWLLIILVIIWFFDEASADLGNYIRKKQSVKLEAYMYRLLHDKAVKLDLEYFEQPEYFDLLSRASRDAPWRPNSILNNLTGMLRSLMSLAIMGGLLVFLHWTIALLLLAVNIPAVWMRIHYADILYNVRREQTSEERKAAYFNWLLTGGRPSRELRLFGLGNYFISLFRKSFLKTKYEELQIIRRRTRIEMISGFVKAAAVFVTLIVVSGETIKGTLTLGQMAMFLLAFRQGMVAIRELLGSVSGLYEDTLFISDTFEFLALREKIIPVSPEADLEVFNESISAENISYSYPGNNVKAVDGITFKINKGEIIAVVGPNGAGKSTLAKLLTRLYDPDSGTFFMDGQDIKHFSPDEYRKLFSVVFQDFMLYNLSAGENIRLGSIESPDSEEKIIASASTAGIDDLIKDLPKGYATVIGNLFDDSRDLSWGEWQKIALARALFRDAPVLILDEPSSALDADTEYEIFSRFREIVRGRTSILISHRFSNVSLADRIIVLDRGKIVETGSHDELINKKGLYYKMYSKQTARFLNEKQI
ncbi:MAG TPA: ABC transporter ATP-binding protein [Bacteroidales bacterium]|nr:ABC transporter ATP-binding protein [Bacteroidales bacterium]HPJ60276.1 ABC transporter ATP-binding protein [Bacteroidales bacterium]HPR11884.1 ABC transporter ATP-binding protein [Bacteroidales bacterium]HRW83967.1 ABC transporter ATP-binding protein [Bacteroidales bacterium]